MRTIWSGSLSFGLLNIPVKLLTASRERTLSFHLFDKSDNCPISYKKVCRVDDRLVDPKDIVKGYEYEKGQFVMLTKEDFKKANVKKTGTIEIMNFVDQEEIDEKYYEKPYYLLPDEKANKAYVLLRDAIKEAGKAAIARYVLKDKEHIAAIKCDGDLIVLIQLRFKDEIVEPSDFPVPKSEYTKKELEMAMSLIKSLEEKFDPSKFKDTFSEDLKKLIAAKAKGKKISTISKGPEPSDMSSVLSLLRKSLEKNTQK